MNPKPALSSLLLILFLLPTIVYAIGTPCPVCGLNVEQGSTFCGNCGTQLTLPSADKPAGTQTPDGIVNPPPIGTLDPSAQQLIGQLSEQDLRRLVSLMMQRLEAREAQNALHPNSVAMMSREELELLLRKCDQMPPAAPKTSSFGAFLQFVGGTVLVILAISIIVSL